MLHFHATLHARSPEVVTGVSIELRREPTPTLIVPPAALANPFALTFEELVQNTTSASRRVFFESGTLIAYLTPVLTPAELQRLRAVLGT